MHTCTELESTKRLHVVQVELHVIKEESLKGGELCAHRFNNKVKSDFELFIFISNEDAFFQDDHEVERKWLAQYLVRCDVIM